MTATTSRIRARKNKVFQSVFQVDVSQPTPALVSAQPGEAFGGPVAFPPSVSLGTSFGTLQQQRGDINDDLYSPQRPHPPPAPPPPPPPQALQPVSDQVRWDRAWHVVTSAIALPPSATADDSFGTLPPESQYAQLAQAQAQAEVEVEVEAGALEGAGSRGEAMTFWRISVS